MTGRELIVKTCGKTLDQLIVEPAKAFFLEHTGCTLLVGLRADEERREGMWGEHVQYRYPLREWGWGIGEVLAYNESRGVTVPDRTDCDYCYDQRLNPLGR